MLDYYLFNIKKMQFSLKSVVVYQLSHFYVKVNQIHKTKL